MKPWLTPHILAAGYEYLRASPPFNSLGLPESDDIGFHVGRDTNKAADFGVEAGIPYIRLSEIHHGHTETVLASLAHEMIHLWQHLRGDREHHGPRFRAMRKKVCAIHGFDPKAF